MIFNVERWDVSFVVRNILAMTSEFDSSFLAEDHTSATPLWWKAPPYGSIKLNVDGSFLRESRAISSGVVLRDAGGHWVHGFACKEGFGSIVEAELLAVRRGLEMAWNIGIVELICEVDSLEAINIIGSASSVLNTALRPILADIRSILSRPMNVQFTHILREANGVADCLAKKGHSLDVESVFWDEPHVELIPFLLDDLIS
ncbi:Ribonuclease H domain [Sesbania bispinosa]|nr:Ribonuclease H domain [Sesbania bispinosa]